MDNQEAKISIITPTTGKDSLSKLIDSLERQTIPWVHIVLWDDKREGDYLFPCQIDGLNDGISAVKYDVKCPHDLEGYSQIGIRYCIEVPGSFINKVAAGSALRAIGLMAANTPYVTFADTDVWYEHNHLESMLNAICRTMLSKHAF